jgi:hypothetical protein
MASGRNFFRTDFGQFLVAMITIMSASFAGTLLAGAILLAVVF